jgi:type IV secretory pathway ATPase VirB11/archaellum biosynthesis ATPase
MAFEVLNSVLRYVAFWYNQHDIEEIAINHEREVWLRLRGKRKVPWIPRQDKNLSKDYLVDLMHIIANNYELPFDPISGKPVVFATLPGNHRFAGITGKNVMYDNDDLEGGIALAIRVYSKDVKFDFEDYGLEKGKKLHKVKKTKEKIPENPFEKLMHYINRGDHILVSGATSTGKTTFLNNLLSTLNKNMRIVTVEDSRELIVPQRNRVHIVLSRTEQTNEFTYANVIDLLVRFTPDAIIGGEISTTNAGAIWELMGSGHENFYATIHAESPDAAYHAFLDRITHTYPHIDRKMVLAEMKRRLRVVQLNRDGNLRAVTEIT